MRCGSQSGGPSVAPGTRIRRRVVRASPLAIMYLDIKTYGDALSLPPLGEPSFCRAPARRQDGGAITPDDETFRR